MENNMGISFLKQTCACFETSYDSRNMVYMLKFLNSNVNWMKKENSYRYRTRISRKSKSMRTRALRMWLWIKHDFMQWPEKWEREEKNKISKRVYDLNVCYPFKSAESREAEWPARKSCKFLEIVVFWRSWCNLGIIN